MGRLNQLEHVVAKLLRQTARRLTIVGRTLTPEQAAAANGGLPLFLRQYEVTAALLGPEAAPWFSGFQLVRDDQALLGARVVEREGGEEDVPTYPLYAMADLVVEMVQAIAPDPKSLDLSLLDPPIQPELFHALDIDRWLTVPWVPWAADTESDQRRPQ